MAKNVYIKTKRVAKTTYKLSLEELAWMYSNDLGEKVTAQEIEDLYNSDDEQLLDFIDELLHEGIIGGDELYDEIVDSENILNVSIS